MSDQRLKRDAVYREERRERERERVVQVVRIFVSSSLPACSPLYTLFLSAFLARSSNNREASKRARDGTLRVRVATRAEGREAAGETAEGSIGKV